MMTVFFIDVPLCSFLIFLLIRINNIIIIEELFRFFSWLFDGLSEPEMIFVEFSILYKKSFKDASYIGVLLVGGGDIMLPDLNNYFF